MPKTPKTIIAIAPIIRLLISLSVVYSFSVNKRVNAQAADTTPPITTSVQTPNSPDGKSNWYVTPVKFDLTATDLESGVKEINYRIDSGTWQTFSFTNTQNLISNPSFETAGATSSGVANWEATVVDPEGTYVQDVDEAVPGYGTASSKIVTTAGLWHGINNQAQFIPTTPFDNMTASVWLKTQNVTGGASFKIYAVSEDGQGGYTYEEIAQSASLAGTNNWTQLSTNFTVTTSTAVGIYIDIGLTGPGTVWSDAVTVNSALSTPQVTATVGSDSASHRFEYYSVDNAGNTEIVDCSASKNCVDFKLDQTPPTNWRNSGAFRGFFGPSYKLWVYATVSDAMSGLSVFTDKYQIHTEEDPGYGTYSNRYSCNSTWEPNTWDILITPPFNPGAKDAFLLTPKTSFCNSNWNQCKIVKFYVEDLAGNSSTKDFCINGPWIKVREDGIVRSNANIDMLAEADGKNTDSLIEASGNDIDFFSSTQNWTVTNTGTLEGYDYQDLWDLTSDKTPTTIVDFDEEDGVYVTNGNYLLHERDFPNNHENIEFNQIYFVDGDLTIGSDVVIHEDSTLLMIVSGDVFISKDVVDLKMGIFADGQISTAYDLDEGDDTETLNLYGVFSADQFIFQRTLQGTDNNDVPSEYFRYEPKYLIQLKDFFPGGSVKWIYAQQTR